MLFFKLIYTTNYILYYIYSIYSYIEYLLEVQMWLSAITSVVSAAGYSVIDSTCKDASTGCIWINWCRFCVMWMQMPASVQEIPARARCFGCCCCFPRRDCEVFWWLLLYSWLCCANHTSYHQHICSNIGRAIFTFVLHLICVLIGEYKLCSVYDWLSLLRRPRHCAISRHFARLWRPGERDADTQRAQIKLE